jgi:hypothetical protein
MALNPNHAFEDLDDIKCAIVEKNCTPERVDFLNKILEFNGFKVVVVKSPPPKVAAKPAVAANPDVAPVEVPPPPPETFTVGVTDVTFSPINAVFNRELLTPAGEVVTSAFWKQLEAAPKKDEWYWRR